MTDIVERLRALVQPVGGFDLPPLLSSAADEIERLRGVVKTLRSEIDARPWVPSERTTPLEGSK